MTRRPPTTWPSACPVYHEAGLRARERRPCLRGGAFPCLADTVARCRPFTRLPLRGQLRSGAMCRIARHRIPVSIRGAAAVDHLGRRQCSGRFPETVTPAQERAFDRVVQQGTAGQQTSAQQMFDSHRQTPVCLSRSANGTLAFEPFAKSKRIDTREVSRALRVPLEPAVSKKRRSQPPASGSATNVT